MKKFWIDNRKFLIIIVGIVALNFYLGFDLRFTIINLLWIAINVFKI